MNKIQERGFFGTPDLIVEVLSTSNARIDKKEKKDIYERFGVKEYFIIDPFEKFVTGFALANDKFVSLEPTIGLIHSRTFGFTIPF